MLSDGRRGNASNESVQWAKKGFQEHFLKKSAQQTRLGCKDRQTASPLERPPHQRQGPHASHEQRPHYAPQQLRSHCYRICPGARHWLPRYGRLLPDCESPSASVCDYTYCDHGDSVASNDNTSCEGGAPTPTPTPTPTPSDDFGVCRIRIGAARDVEMNAIAL